MLIAVDFDGTIVEHAYPRIGRELPFATETLRRLIADGHRLVLWTLRRGALLDEAVAWCRERGVTFYAANADYPEQVMGPDVSRKIKYDLVIDDRMPGGLPNWSVLYALISRGITLEQYLREQLGAPQPKKSWWRRG